MAAPINLDFTTWTVLEFEKFLLVFARVASILLLMPVFGARQIPVQFKQGLALMLTIVFYSTIQWYPKEVLPVLPLAYQVAIQFLVGAVLGFASLLVFIAILLGGQIIDLEMGFAIANLIDPVSNLQQTLLGQFQYIIALLFFLAMNGHHYFVDAVARSFDILPLDVFHYRYALHGKLTAMLSEVFVVAFQLAFPVAASLFLSDLVLGFLSRLVPQMNVFVVGFPLKLALGFFALIFCLSIAGSFYPHLFRQMHHDILSLLRLMR
jgi:flagellar biosynthetic protein FliR